MYQKYFSLAAFLLLVLAASLAGSAFDTGEWYYAILKRPSMAPPGWLYAAVSALISVLLAFAAWKIWLTGHFSRLSVLTWWVLLLVFNTGWAVLFFGWHRSGWSLPLLGLAIVMAIFCIRAFRPLSREAAWLMAPFLVWSGYLWAFNLAAWTINGGFLGKLLS